MEGKVINISSLVGSVKKEFLYNDEEKKILKKVLSYEMNDLEYICAYVEKEDKNYLKKAHDSLGAILNKINELERNFSFKEYDFLLGACVEIYKKYLGTDDFSTYELLMIKDLIMKIDVVYKSFDGVRNKREKGMEL